MSRLFEFLDGENKEEFDVDYDESLFDEMVEFILTLEPNQLTDEQNEAIIDLYEDFEIASGEDGDEDDDEDEDIEERRLAKRTKAGSRRKAKAYYRRHKSKIKRRKKKFKRSAKGKKRKRMTKLKAKSGRTATGRKKVRYH